MDKQMIEEMAIEIAKRDCYLYDKCPKEPKHNCVSQDPEIMLESSKNYITIATWLVKAGYRKIPENAVVLTRKEKLKEVNDLVKEKLKKFAERVKMAFYYEFDELIPSIMADKIDEIAKELEGENVD